MEHMNMIITEIMAHLVEIELLFITSERKEKVLFLIVQYVEKSNNVHTNHFTYKTIYIISSIKYNWIYSGISG